MMWTYVLIRHLAAAVAGFWAFAVVLAAPSVAHEIPASVQLQAFVKPESSRLVVLVRMPMAALVEVELPLRGPGYLEMTRIDRVLRGAAQLYLIDNMRITENSAPLLDPKLTGVRVSLPSDRSFAAFETARASFSGPALADKLDLVWNQQFLDVALEYPIGSERSDFALRWHVDRFGRSVTTALRFLSPAGAERAYALHGDPGLLRLDPRWHHAAGRFLGSGVWHILSGLDHLLFLLCLVLPFWRSAAGDGQGWMGETLRPLLVIVTAFTVAHSIALISAALGFVPDGAWFAPLIETVIAATIVWMALENIVVTASDRTESVSRRWMVAFAFGLVHGFGFSFGLTETLQFAGNHLLTALFAFNVGVEIGQLAVLAVVLPAIALLYRRVVPERLGLIILSALVAHIGWHWMLERGEQLAKFPFPAIDAAFLAGAMRGLMAVLVLAALVWLVRGPLERWLDAGGRRES